jgi:hyperosmotically inducible protein
MKTHRTQLILSITLVSALSVFVTGCNQQQGTSTPSVPSTTAPSTTVGTKIDDSVVTTRVKSALLSDPSIKSFDIAVVTRKNEVQLSGFVDNQAQIDRAIEITRGVEGVESVTNKMSIKQ